METKLGEPADLRLVPPDPSGTDRVIVLDEEIVHPARNESLVREAKNWLTDIAK